MLYLGGLVEFTRLSPVHYHHHLRIHLYWIAYAVRLRRTPFTRLRLRLPATPARLWRLLPAHLHTTLPTHTPRYHTFAYLHRLFTTEFYRSTVYACCRLPRFTHAPHADRYCGSATLRYAFWLLRWFARYRTFAYRAASHAPVPFCGSVWRSPRSGWFYADRTPHRTVAITRWFTPRHTTTFAAPYCFTYLLPPHWIATPLPFYICGLWLPTTPVTTHLPFCHTHTFATPLLRRYTTTTYGYVPGL